MNFLKSPFWGRKKQLIRVAKIFDRAANENSELTDKIFFNNLFPGKIFNDAILRQVLTHFQKALEEFACYLEFRGQQYDHPVRLLRFLNRKKLGKYFPHYFGKISSELYSAEIPVNEIFHKRLVEIEEEHLNYTKGLIPLREGEIYQNSLDHLDSFYFKAKLQLVCDAIGYDMAVNSCHTFRFTKELDQFLEASKCQGDKLLELHHLAFLILTRTEEESIFRGFKKKLEEFLKPPKKYHKQELEKLAMHGVNYCISKFNQKKIIYSRDIVDFYSLMLDNDLLLEGGYLSGRNFKNIFMTMLHIGEIGEASEFLISRKKNLEGMPGLAYLNFCKGYFNFVQNNFDDARTDLSNAGNCLGTTEEIDLWLEIRVMTMMVAYELGKLSEAKKLIMAFLENKTDFCLATPGKLESTSSLAEFLLRLIETRKKRKSQLDMGEITQLYSEVSTQNQRFYARKWLMGKIAAIKK